MTRPLLVIGATGNIGSASVRAALKRNIPTIAFLRTPSKLPSDLQPPSSNLTIIKGDARSKQSISDAVTNGGNLVSSVIVAAPMGSMRERGKTHYEEIAKNVAEAVQEAQKADKEGRKIKLWIMAGSALLDHPEFEGQMLNSFMPVSFYEEYEYTWRDMQNRFQDIDWSFNCPALIRSGEPRGPSYSSTEVLPGYIKPFGLTRLLPFKFGYACNIMFSNWMPQPITFPTLGEFMVEHLELDGAFKHKRVGVLEDPNAKA